MDKKIDVIFGIIIVSICVGMSFYCYHRGLIRGRAEATENITKPDTTYNKVILDSIEYNIKKKDSVIVEIKKKIKYEIEEANNLNDSDAIILFKQLASE